jgi:hypothetical protein
MFQSQSGPHPLLSPTTKLEGTSPVTSGPGTSGKYDWAIVLHILWPYADPD